MKIIIEKVIENPPHSLTKNDLKIFFENIPNEWNTGFKTVKLCNSIYPKSDYNYYNNRPVDLYNGNLNIHSRGLSKLEIIEEILIELCQKNSGNLNLREQKHNSMTKNQRKQLEQIIAPVLKEFQNLL